MNKMAWMRVVTTIILQSIAIEGFMMNSIRRPFRNISIQLQMNTDTNTDTHGTTLLSTLLSKFQGDFDNYNQVYSDRKSGMLPREGGGHEHFHVTLLPISPSLFPLDVFPIEGKGGANIDIESSCGVVVAAYYFDGMPNRIFRLRMYTLYSDEEESRADEESSSEKVKMKLYTFHPMLEGKLRKESEAVVEKWAQIVGDHVSEHKHDSFTELERCDILWTRETHPVRHSYLEKYSDQINTKNLMDPVHAIMVNDHEKGGVLLESQMKPGSYIRIQDELSLWENELWVNDRGHDAESKAMVYGNWNGVPYQMSRVANLSSSSQDGDGALTRDIIDADLQWTLGGKWRSQEEYETKMADVGGVTTIMNKNASKKAN
jgi:hypothetical protein